MTNSKWGATYLFTPFSHELLQGTSDLVHVCIFGFHFFSCECVLGSLCKHRSYKLYHCVVYWLKKDVTYNILIFEQIVDGQYLLHKLFVDVDAYLGFCDLLLEFRNQALVSVAQVTKIVLSPAHKVKCPTLVSLKRVDYALEHDLLFFIHIRGLIIIIVVVAPFLHLFVCFLQPERKYDP